MSFNHQASARCDLESEARNVFERLKRALLSASSDTLALVQSASSGNYRFVDPRGRTPQGLLGLCDADTTLEQIRGYMIGQPNSTPQQRVGARRSP